MAPIFVGLCRHARNAVNYPMLRRLVISLVIPVIIIGFAIPSVYSANTGLHQIIIPITQCNDGIDNDHDGLVDYASDPDCTSFSDDNESPNPVTPTPTQTPFVTKSVILGQSNQKNSTTSETSVSNTINKIAQEYLWEPMGKVLGVENITGDTNPNFIIVSFFILAFILALVNLFIIILILRRYRNANKK